MAGQTLTWNDRFALIDYYKPSDTEICNIFNIDVNSLNVARNFRSTGQFKPTADIDVKSYAHMFNTVQIKSAKKNEKKKTATSTVKPITATKTQPILKKRGRKGNNIKSAFDSITTTPVSVDNFSKQHGVSVAVIRQGKRFDTKPEAGTVRVKKIERDGKKVLCVWREKSLNA